MKKLFLIFMLASLCSGGSSYAQIVAGECFLQGNFLEIGMWPNGALGAGNSPVGYHAHPSAFPSTATFSSGPGVTLAETYDFGHDGWSTGTPCDFMGDYTYPGSPFEGWEVQVAGNRCQGYQGYTTPMFQYSGTGTMTGGGFTSYTTSGGQIKGMQMGTYNGLDMYMETRVDPGASWVVMTVKFYNNTASNIPGVYYWRSCDPDNDQAWSSPPTPPTPPFPIGGTPGFTTDNSISYQNDALHRVEVTARGMSTLAPPLGLGTKDARAVAVIYNSWGLTVSQDLAAVWNKTYGPTRSTFPGAEYTPHAWWQGDIGIGLVFNIGTICAHDSATISYAYIFNDSLGIDDAFPDPQLSIAGGPMIGAGGYDTLDACLYPGVDSIPLDMSFADDKSWTWSTWTWSPGTALSTTTGTHTWVHLNAVPGVITYTLTGMDSVMNPCDSNSALGLRQYFITIKSCHDAWNNSPCYGDALLLGMRGDSLGATYKWIGPHSWTSTLHDPVIKPALYTDSGLYRVIRTIGGINDTDSTRVVIHEKPKTILTNNAPMCANTLDTLYLQSTPALPGEQWNWVGPNAFTSSLQNPVLQNFQAADTGIYTLYTITPFGCKDTTKIRAGLVDPPLPPTVSGTRVYCQGQPYVGLKADPFPIGTIGTVKYDSIKVQHLRLSSPPTFFQPGTHFIFATTTNSFGCESQQTQDSVRIITKPGLPSVSGAGLDYCQYIGPFNLSTLTLAHTDALPHWWTVPLGGSPTPVEPIVNLSVPGTTTYYISQNDSTCESDRTSITITVHPKPTAPTIKSDTICQFFPASAMVATASGSGDVIRWFIPPDTIGTLTAPIPVTLVPGVYQFLANETTKYGCVSNDTTGYMTVKPKPAPPIPHDTVYCQFFKAPKLTADSIYGGYLRWYMMGTRLPMAPVPTNAHPGDSTWFVSEVINGCESDSLPLKVTTIYKPQFAIEASSPFVCQFDSVRFAYKGPSLFDPKYSWGIPPLSVPAHGPEGMTTTVTDSFLYVRFDSVTANNYITLHVTNDHGFCSGDTSFRIKIVPQPLGKAATKGDVCAGDTVTLALGSKSASASNFLWFIDKVQMDKSNAVSIVAHNSNTGGPFSISWNDSGRHAIQLVSRTDEGCTSLPTEDTINVHTMPDAGFTYSSKNGTLCLEDSILFTANATDYNYAYMWSPEHFFSNVNKRQLYGRVELAASAVTLQVTDPFGCVATSTQTLTPGECCRVSFPSAFLPNGGTKNTVFRPIYQGYHRFSIFRIANRWGQTVYESTNNGMSWDGTMNSVPQDAGVYFYYIKYDCGGKSLEQTGDVTLIR